MLSWLRRRFITGFFVTVPLIVSVAALVWGFGVVDGVTAPLYQRLLGRDVPGLGLLTGALAVLMVGVLAANVIGRRILQRLEHWLLLVPVFRTVYAPVKQLIAAFSPDNETGFKQVVLVDDPARGVVMGFLTREFVLADPSRAAPADGRGVRAHQSPVPRRCPHLSQATAAISRLDRRRRHPDFPDRRDGHAGARRGSPRAVGGGSSYAPDGWLI